MDTLLHPWCMEPSEFLGHTAYHSSMPQYVSLRGDGIQYVIPRGLHAYLIRAVPQEDGETWLCSRWGLPFPSPFPLPDSLDLDYFLLPLEVLAASSPPDKIYPVTQNSLSSTEWAGCTNNYTGEFAAIPEGVFNVLYTFAIENMYVPESS